MDLFRYIVRFLYKIRWYLIILPLIALIVAWFSTRNMERVYDTNTTIYTGMITAYNIEGGSGTAGGNTQTNMTNLILLISTDATIKVRRCNFTLVNDLYPWACANVDREVVGEDAILECKTTSSYENMTMFKGGEYPTRWLCQMMHYLAVTGRQKAYLAVLSQNRDFHIFELERDEEDIRTLMEAEKEFWNNYVLPGVQPPVDDSEVTAKVLAEMYPTANDTEVILDMDEDLLERRKLLKETEKSVKKELDGIDNEIKAKMGSASTATCGSYKISFKEQATSGIDRKRISEDFPTLDFKQYATRARVLRVSSPKEKTA